MRALKAYFSKSRDFF